jgi:hypothetical protein
LILAPGIAGFRYCDGFRIHERPRDEGMSLVLQGLNRQ